MPLDKGGQGIEAPQDRPEFRGSQRNAAGQCRQHLVMRHGSAPGPFALVHPGLRRGGLRRESADDRRHAAKPHKLHRPAGHHAFAGGKRQRIFRTPAGPRRRRRCNRSPRVPPPSCRASLLFLGRVASLAGNLKQNGLAQFVAGAWPPLSILRRLAGAGTPALAPPCAR